MDFDPSVLTLMPFGLPGKIYRSPMPFRDGDKDGALFEQYQQAGIQVVVVLAEAEECQRKTGRDLLKYYIEQGLSVIHCPIRDFTAPESPSALHEAILTTLNLAQQGKAIAVHCFAGYGRTGLFMGCLARQHLGFSGDHAVAWVRRYIPGAVENQAQVEYVNDYEMIQ